MLYTKRPQKSLYLFMLLIIVITVPILTKGLLSSSQIVGEKPQKTRDTLLPVIKNIKVEVWIKGLTIPWSLVFFKDGRAIVSERSGKIRLIKNGRLEDRPYASIDVAHTGEGGLMGLAIHPDFPEKPFIYAMHTYRKSGRLYNRVIRLIDKGGEAIFDRVIIDNIPGARFHNGGRIAFGPDRMLYITTGDARQPQLAQDVNSLAGKILRVRPDGSIPDDNPFKGSPVYSYGHRNPQGIAWDIMTGRLFSSEHGPSGEFGNFAHDEINIILKGGNYGWPEVIGAPRIKPYIDPVVVWKRTTPPSGITFYNGELLKWLKGNLFVASLRGETLIRIDFDEVTRDIKKIERWFAKDFDEGLFGRIRDVVEGPDGAIYFLTNNTDGRGIPMPGDDKIYRITPK